jgi:Glycosyl hydrolases family 18
MSGETFINYWIGEEPTPPTPTLDQMPAYVGVAPLAVVNIDAANNTLEFSDLCSTHSEASIKAAIKTVRARGTKVLFSINDVQLGSVPNVPVFVNNVVKAVLAWGVDGIDFDFEPPDEPSQTLVPVVTALRPALRAALGREPLLIAPIYSPWLFHVPLLQAFAAQLDFVTTMDYADANGSIGCAQQFMDVLKAPEKVAIGTICMSPGYMNTLADVAKMAAWEPTSGHKRGAMLYTFTYDVKERPRGGTGYPDGTYTKTIHEKLP